MDSLIPFLVFIAATVLGWYAPQVGVGFAVASIPAYLVKFNIGPIPTQLNELILLGVALGWVIRQPQANCRAWLSALKSIWWQALLLLIGVAIGVIVSTDLRLSLGIVKGWFIDPIILYGLVAAVWRPQQIGSLVALLVVSTLPISLTALYQVATHQFITIDNRASAWFVSANYLSLYLVPVLLLGVGLFYRPRLRPLAWIATLCGVAAVFFSLSYGGWLALVVGSLVLGAWQFRRSWKFWITSGGLALAAAASQLGSDRVARMLDVNTQSSASVRLQIWAADWLMIKQSWLTGIGLGRYPAVYPDLVRQLFATPLEPSVLHAHNLYLHFLINAGLLGLVGFLSLIAKFFSWVRHAATAWAAPLVAAMVAILVHGLVDTPYWKNDLALLFWVLLALAQLHSRSPSPSHE